MLSAATTTPESVFFAVWNGWDDIPLERVDGAAHIGGTWTRGYYLLRGPLSGALEPIFMSGFPETVSGLWWPSDRSWFVTTDVDLEWTFVAGSHCLVDRIVEHPGLEAVATARGNPVHVPEGPE